MAQRTKQAIIDSTLALAQKKPLHRITVREIVEDCDITRNTFYYYFRDVYDVLTCYFEMEFDRILENSEHDKQGSIVDFMVLCIRHKAVWLNFYKSVDREQFTGYVKGKIIRPLLSKAIGQDADTSQISASDRELLTIFYEEALAGILLRWLTDRRQWTTEEMLAVLNRTRVLFDGQLELLLRNAQKPTV